MAQASSIAPMAEVPRLVALLRPIINRVAATPASVHTKLLAGFLSGALLLLAMGGLSVAVQAHMAARDTELTRVERRLDLLRQMQYLVTAQSHYRAMALLTHDASNLVSLASAKAQFSSNLDAVEQNSPDAQRGLLLRVRAANDRFAASSERVLTLEQQGLYEQAMQLHLQEEHPITHEVESAMAALVSSAENEADQARAVLESDQRLLMWLVVAFSVASLATALLLGFAFSWSFLLPLERIRGGLAQLAAGRFDERVEVVNRDEFGELGRNMDATRRELAEMYGELATLNAQLRGTNTELLIQLQEQVVELARSRGMITEAEERLRRDIAEVLHSRVQNRLLVLWYRLEECQELVERDPEAARQLLNELRTQLDEIREQDVRQLSHRLHPSIIRAGLIPALESLTEELPRLAVELKIDADAEAVDEAGLPEVVRLTAYRVVEEALGNITKHAAANQVEVNVSATATDLVVRVYDDGRGFDMQTARPGLGLAAIAARVERIGGVWTIDAAPGRGTCVEVHLPRSADQAQDGVAGEVPLGQKGGANGRGSMAVTPAV